MGWVPSFRLVRLQTLLLGALAAPCAWAEDAEPPVAIHRAEGLGGVMFGGGTAFVSDASSMDLNPAGLSLNRLRGPGYFLDLGFALHRRKVHVWDASLIDSIRGVVDGGVKARWSNAVTGGKLFRGTVALAEALPETPLIVGIAGDYTYWRADPPQGTGEKPDADWRLRAGLIYLFGPSLAFGIRSGSYSWTSEPDKRHVAGVAWNALDSLMLTADAHFSDSEFVTATGSASVVLGEAVHLLASYGYDVLEKHHGVGGAVAFLAGHVRISYGVTQEVFRESVCRHTLNLTMDLAPAMAGSGNGG